MLKVEDFGSLSSDTFRSFVKKISKNGGNFPPSVLGRFKRESYDSSGVNVKVVTEDGIDYKMTPTLGNNKFKDGKAYLSSYYLQVFISYIVHYIFTYDLEDPIDTYVVPLGSKVISRKGFSWYETSNQCDLESYLNKIYDTTLMDMVLMKSIFEVSDTLENLKEYNFIHNDLKASNVFVHEDPKDDSDDRFRFRISDFDDSYIEFNELKIGVNNSVFDILSENIELEYIDENYYKINSLKDVSSRNASLLFRKKRKKLVSIDIYTFVLSLIFHPNVIEHIDKLPLFNKLVDSIFCEEDIEKIKDIMYSDPLTNISDITGFILVNEIKILYVPDYNIKSFFSKYMS